MRVTTHSASWLSTSSACEERLQALALRLAPHQQPLSSAASRGCAERLCRFEADPLVYADSAAVEGRHGQAECPRGVDLACEPEAGVHELLSEAPSREIRPHPESYVERNLAPVDPEPLSGRDPRVFAKAEISHQISAFVVDGVVAEAWLQKRVNGGGISVVDRIGTLVAPARDGPCVARRDRLQGEAQRENGEARPPE